ncbi:MAG: helix-turn-helix transcriptional regulator [Clostridia bacterium]|nr:helix-turn-helix transcriptional regulator [Clostridia bacterium]MBQ5769761.1 helix-turn-helix transcriptional regulator [Clostridia bacterium]
MDVGKKIQRLRTERALTQGQLAEKLFVSRTAVSKWETGRGTPNIESLKLIAKEFNVTLDELLRAEEAIEVCEKEHRKRNSKADAILNLCAGLALILPLYKAEMGEKYVSVPIYAFTGRFIVLFWIIPAILFVLGAVQLAVRKGEEARFIGVFTDACAVIVFILTGQPYPAVLYFVFLLLKMAISGKIPLTRKESRK